MVRDRLSAAAARLPDPACAHLPIGVAAYGCGPTPRDHRHAARAGTP
ncbi:hypothetical protein [Methylobacterium sp. Leaf361]|nr:hypothetical protein [Methylobacterium sp. Leaf361]